MNAFLFHYTAYAVSPVANTCTCIRQKKCFFWWQFNNLCREIAGSNQTAVALFTAKQTTGLESESKRFLILSTFVKKMEKEAVKVISGHNLFITKTRNNYQVGR